MNGAGGPLPVAQLRCARYADVGHTLQRAFELLAPWGPFAAAGEPLLVKPNLLMARPAESAVTTHPAVVDAALAAAADLGARPVVADSPGLGSVERAAAACGVAAVCRRHGVPLLDLGRAPAVAASSSRFRDLWLAREALEARWLWNLPKWKTHTMMGLTLGVKNLFGCVPGKRKIAAHFRAGRDHGSFARQLLALDELLAPCFTFLDGVVAMEGPGPSRGTPVPWERVLASPHAAALDWVATGLSGFAAPRVPSVHLSLQEGRVEPDRVHLLGDRLNAGSLAPAPGSPCDWQLPGLLKRLLRGTVAPAPAFRSGDCSGCGACVEACPAGALRVGTPPELAERACIRCYCCQELCPTGAAFVPQRPLLRALFVGRRSR